MRPSTSDAVACSACALFTTVSPAKTVQPIKMLFVERTRVSPKNHAFGVHMDAGGSVTEWLACWTQAQNGLGSNRCRDAVG